MKNFEHKSKFIFLCTANSFYTCQATKSFCLQLEAKSSIPLHPTWSIWFLLTPASIGQRFPWKAVMVFHSKELAEIVPKKIEFPQSFVSKIIWTFDNYTVRWAWFMPAPIRWVKNVYTAMPATIAIILQPASFVEWLTHCTGSGWWWWWWCWITSPPAYTKLAL